MVSVKRDKESRRDKEELQLLGNEVSRLRALQGLSNHASTSRMTPAPLHLFINKLLTRLRGLERTPTLNGADCRGRRDSCSASSVRDPRQSQRDIPTQQPPRRSRSWKEQSYSITGRAGGRVGLIAWRVSARAQKEKHGRTQHSCQGHVGKSASPL